MRRNAALVLALAFGYIAATCGVAAAGGPLIVNPDLISTLSTPIGETPTDFQWPLCTETGPGFGYSVDGFTGKVRFHTGLDFRGGYGLEVRTIAPGRVIAAERRGPYGLLVEIDHGRGYRSRYAQLQMTAVNPGDVVRAGQVVARVGSSGRSSGPHLHLEIWYNDMAINPLRVLRLSQGCETARKPTAQGELDRGVRLGGSPGSSASPSTKDIAQRQRNFRFAWPVCAPGKAFGTGKDPFTGREVFHSGADFKGPAGTPIRAAANGRVLLAMQHGPYGLMIEIDHGYGFRTRYGHLRAENVIPEQMVQRGQVIGEMGSTGRSTGPHLHFEIWLNDVVRNPRNYLERDPACWRVGRS